MNPIAKKIFELLIDNPTDPTQLRALLNSTPPKTLITALDYRFPMDEPALDADEQEIRRSRHYGRCPI